MPTSALSVNGTIKIQMIEPIHILLVDDDPAENLILQGLIKKVTAMRIQLHYCETIDDALSLALHHLSQVLKLLSLGLLSSHISGLPSLNVLEKFVVFISFYFILIL